MKIIAIGGEPGSGKTTLMKQVINITGVVPEYDSFKLVPYLRKDNLYILGKYEEGEVFAGTDRMSMAVQPEAIKFLTTLSEYSVVLFEGDRLFNTSFLGYCVDNYDTSIVYLATNPDVRKERYKERGSEQNETWLQGRETKINNILTNFSLMFNIEKFEHNRPEDHEKVLEYIKERIYNV